jgi:hypothetical protein
MKTHNQLIYHCERCGHLVHQEPDDPCPACCGTSMTQAAATTVNIDDDFDSSVDDSPADEGTTPLRPRLPK